MPHKEEREDPIEKIRTKISEGYRVVVPSRLRRRYEIGVGDLVLWESSEKGITVDLRKKPEIANIVALGASGKKSSSVDLKKRIQKGKL